MTSHDAFLQSIIENPAEDALRLIYADWLEEHDQPERAEFIRVQCELANLKELPILRCSRMSVSQETERLDTGWRYSDEPYSFLPRMQARAELELEAGQFLPSVNSEIEAACYERTIRLWAVVKGIVEQVDAGTVLNHVSLRVSSMSTQTELPQESRWCLLKKRERDLLEKNGFKWKTNSAPSDFLAWVGRQPLFRRGFIAEITCTCADWLLHGPALVKLAPLEKVTLSDKEPYSHYAGDPAHWHFCTCLYFPHESATQYLPSEIAQHFQFAPRGDGDKIWSFRSCDEAQAALSQACLAWAHSMNALKRQAKEVPDLWPDASDPCWAGV